MVKPQLESAVEKIIGRDPRYAPDAYFFVNDAVSFTVKALRSKGIKGGLNPHVTGPELLQGIRRYALDQYGPMAHALLDHWNVRSCEDFGEIVFNLVDAGMLGKNESDRREDFKGGYAFDDAFLKPFRPERPISLARGRRRTGTKPRARKSRDAASGETSGSSSPKPKR